MLSPQPEGVAAAVRAVPEPAEGSMQEDAITQSIHAICSVLYAKSVSW